MLSISKISNKDAYMEEWRQERLGHFTASTNSKLISEKSHLGKFTDGAITHIEGIAGEILTRQPAKREFMNADVDYGNAMEAEAISYFEQKTGRVVLRDINRGDTHRLIMYDEYCCCTPDSLVAMVPENEIFNEDKTKLKVATLEVKCPPIHHRYIKLYKCITPADLKIEEPVYYWQVITQMHHCESLFGFFGAYNPAFPNPMRVIEFKKSEVIDDIRKLAQTLVCAKMELERTLTLLKN